MIVMLQLTVNMGDTVTALEPPWRLEERELGTKTGKVEIG